MKGNHNYVKIIASLLTLAVLFYVISFSDIPKMLISNDSDIFVKTLLGTLIICGMIWISDFFGEVFELMAAGIAGLSKSLKHERGNDGKKTVVLIVGPSGSGKTTLVNYLHNSYGYPFVCSYTTRKMREGEVNGVDHIFVDESEMPPKEDMIAYTLFGGNHYWATHDQIKDKPTLYVIDEDGVRYFNERFGHMYNTVNVYVDRLDPDVDEERRERDLNRKPMGEDFKWDLRLLNDKELHRFLREASTAIIKKAPL